MHSRIHLLPPTMHYALFALWLAGLIPGFQDACTYYRLLQYAMFALWVPGVLGAFQDPPITASPHHAPYTIHSTMHYALFALWLAGLKNSIRIPEGTIIAAALRM